MKKKIYTPPVVLLTTMEMGRALLSVSGIDKKDSSHPSSDVW